MITDTYMLGLALATLGISIAFPALDKLGKMTKRKAKFFLVWGIISAIIGILSMLVAYLGSL